jgi:hypothetical protein
VIMRVGVVVAFENEQSVLMTLFKGISKHVQVELAE